MRERVIAPQDHLWGLISGVSTRTAAGCMGQATRGECELTGTKSVRRWRGWAGRPGAPQIIAGRFFNLTGSFFIKEWHL